MTSAREKRIAHEAAQWVVKFDGVAFDARDVRAFRRWLARSPDHRAAFQAASRTWNRLDLLSQLDAFPLPTSAGPPAMDRRALFGAAAAAAIAVGVGAVVWGPTPALAYETGIGEVREVDFGEGVLALLNAGTRVEARFNARRRRLRVVRGEALFSIAQAEGAPVQISTPAGGAEVSAGQVLVKVLPEGARLSFLTARARAWRRGAINRESMLAVDALNEIRLGSDEVRVSRLEAALAARRMSWRDGRLAFDDTPLAEAVADVSRQTGAEFHFADPAIAQLRIGGLVDARDLDAFLLMLRENLAVAAERRADGSVLLSSTATLTP